MKMINHGTWSSYVPNPIPQGLMPNTLFAKSDTTAQDWYDALYNKTSPLLAAGSVAITAMKDDSGVWRTMAATKDATALFPARQLLLEVTGFTGTDPQLYFGGKQYVEASNSIEVIPLPSTAVISVTPRQARLALLAAGLLDQASAAVAAAGGATLITWEYATEFLRNDPLIISIGASLNLTPAQIDALFAQAATL
jgi:hypothetical protein